FNNIKFTISKYIAQHRKSNPALMANSFVFVPPKVFVSPYELITVQNAGDNPSDKPTYINPSAFYKFGDKSQHEFMSSPESNSIEEEINYSKAVADSIQKKAAENNKIDVKRNEMINGKDKTDARNNQNEPTPKKSENANRRKNRKSIKIPKQEIGSKGEISSMSDQDVKILQIFETGNMLLALPVNMFGAKIIPSEGAFTTFAKNNLPFSPLGRNPASPLSNQNDAAAAFYGQFKNRFFPNSQKTPASPVSQLKNLGQYTSNLTVRIPTSPLSQLAQSPSPPAEKTAPSFKPGAKVGLAGKSTVPPGARNIFRETFKPRTKIPAT
ncbi:hypothetical protein MHBO_003970, partial [Bonamia ostreae]